MCYITGSGFKDIQVYESLSANRRFMRLDVDELDRLKSNASTALEAGCHRG